MNIGETGAALPVIDAAAGVAAASPVGAAAGFADRLAEAMGGSAVPGAAGGFAGAGVDVAAGLATKLVKAGDGAGFASRQAISELDLPEAGLSDGATCEGGLVPEAAWLRVPVWGQPDLGAVSILAAGAEPVEGVTEDGGAVDGGAVDGDAADGAGDDGKADGVEVEVTLPVLAVAPVVPVAVPVPAVVQVAADFAAAAEDGAVVSGAGDARDGRAVSVGADVERPVAAGTVAVFRPDLNVAKPDEGAVVEAAPVAVAGAGGAGKPVAFDAVQVGEVAQGRDAVQFAEAVQVGAVVTVRVVVGTVVPAGPRAGDLDDTPSDPVTSGLAQMPRGFAVAAERVEAQPVRTDLPGWERVLAERITAELSGDGQEIELSLSPEKLGPLRIKLEMVDGLAQVRIITATPEAARVFTEAQHRLTEGLARAGIDLGSQSARSDGQGGRAESGQSGGQSGGNGDDRSGLRGHANEFMTLARRNGAGDAVAVRRSGAGLVNLIA